MPGPPAENGPTRAPAPIAARQTCYGCFKPSTLCLCGRVPAVDNRTRITILQHPRERFHAIGTARIARLGLRNAEVLLPRAVALRSLEIPLDVAPGSALLFPGESARELSDLVREAPPPGLVVLDGTWAQARGLLRENPGLKYLPRVRLTPPGPSRYRIRRSPRGDYLSTIEAIVEALRLLEPETLGLDGLLGAFETMIDEQIVYANRNPRRPLRKIARAAQRGVQRPQAPEARSDGVCLPDSGSLPATRIPTPPRSKR